MDLKARIPDGTQDLLPLIAEEKRIIEEKILELFKGWGYQEIVTPTLEYFDTLSAGTGENLQNKMYKLFDRSGRILALRAEMTAPIARLVATKLKNLLPARLCYLANIFRYEDLKRGRYREFYQAGLEFIGGSKPGVDAEVLALAVKALERVGLQNFTIHVGHMLFFMGLCEEYQLHPKTASGFRNALMNRDFVTLKEEINRSSLHDLQKENLLSLPTLQKKGAIPEKAYHLARNPLSTEAIHNLEEILKHLRLLGVEDHCYVDLGIFRHLDYYSGMVFEGFTQGVGYNICGGGRYDRLLGEFGSPNPACGFALGIDRLLIALQKEELVPRKESYLILYQSSREERAYELLLALKKEKKICELELMGRPFLESKAYAIKKGIRYILYVGDSPPFVFSSPREEMAEDVFSLDLLARRE